MDQILLVEHFLWNLFSLYVFICSILTRYKYSIINKKQNKNILYFVFCGYLNPRHLGELTLYDPHVAQEIAYLCESPWIIKVKYEFHN
jgi:hypothetical protein